MNKSKSTRWSMWAVLMITLVPLVLAFVMYFQQIWLPASGTNLGQLLIPPKQFPEAQLSYHQQVPLNTKERQWTLLFHHQDACHKACGEHLYTLRQVHLALGKEAHRVRRLLLVDDISQWSDIVREYPHLFVASLTDKTVLNQGEGIYVVDPLGNIMMYYDFDQTGKPILKDVKKLLKNSNIG